MNRYVPAEGAPRPRLLAVDDQVLNLQVLHQIFGADHEVLIATGGVQALEVARRERPDLILLDVEMPDLDGVEVCRRLKQDSQTRDIPVLFITSHHSPAEEALGLEVGAVDFISKPLHPAVVRARVATQLTLKRQSDLLRNMAFVDGLTGIANRRRFDEALDGEWRRCARDGEQLSLALVDVDYFKSFNDLYGHQAGDACLQTVARCLGGVVRRPRDLIARYGGEEFACLIPACAAAVALELASAMRAAVAQAAIPHRGSGCAEVVTISVGVATLEPGPGRSPTLLLSAADAQLYAAKHEGRNRVCSSRA